MARFVNHMISEKLQVSWAGLQRGEFITDAAEGAGTYRRQGTRWVIANGGVRRRRGRNLKGRCLSFGEREGIALRGGWRVDASDRGAVGKSGNDLA